MMSRFTCTTAPSSTFSNPRPPPMNPYQRVKRTPQHGFSFLWAVQTEVGSIGLFSNASFIDLIRLFAMFGFSGRSFMAAFLDVFIMYS